MPNSNKVEIDVRLKTDQLGKDFDQLGKDAKSEAKKVASALDDMSDEMEEVGDDAKDMGDSFSKATNDMKESASKSKASADDLGDSVKKLGDNLDEAGDKASVFGDVLKGSLASAAIEKGMGLLTQGVQSVISGALEMENATSKLAASTGATTEEMEQYSAVLSDMYKNNYGESMEDLADSMALIRQYTGEIDASTLQTMTEDALTLSDTFDMDLSETIRGVDSLMNNMGLTAEEAFDYIAKGAQNGLDKSGELGDNIAEYGQLWSQAGFSAEEMFTILQNGLDAGAYNLDKVNDFVKEFGISLSDGRIEENLSSFSSGTKDLFEQWQNGEASTKDVFYSVISDLSNMTDQQEALTIASNTWSSLGEDNAMSVITSLGAVSDKYSDVKGAMESIKSVRYDSLSNQYQQLGRQLQTSVITPVLTKFLPVAQAGLKTLANNIDKIIPVATGAGTAIATIWITKKAKTLISSIKDTAKGIGELVTNLLGHTSATVADTAATTADTAAKGAQATATTGAAVAQEGLNTAMASNPVGLLVTGIAALVTGLTAFSALAGDGSASKLADEMEDARKEAEESNEEYQDLSDTYKTNSDEIMSLWRQVQELSDVENKSAEQKQKLSNLVDELNRKVPDLGLSYDSLSDSLSQTADSIDEVVRAAAAQAAYDSALEAKTQAAEDYNTAAAKQKDIEKQLTDAEKRLKKEIADNSQYYETYGDTVNGTQLEVNDLKDALENADKTVEENAELLEQATLDAEYYGLMLADVDDATRQLIDTTLEQIDSLGQGDEAYTEAVDALSVLTDAHTSTRETINAEIESIKTEMDSLQQKYDEAYNSTYTSISGVLGVFNTMPETVGTAITNTISALDSQIAYMDTYNANIKWAMENGVDEGIIATLSDGSTESAAILQGIVDDGGAHISDLNEKFGKVEEGKEKFSSTIADMETDFTDSMADLQAKNEEAIAELNQADKAFESGVNTIQGYINGSEDMRDDLVTKYTSLANAATTAYNNALEIKSPSRKFIKSGRNTIQGAIVGGEKEKSNLEATYKSLGVSALNAYKKAQAPSVISAMHSAVNQHGTTIQAYHSGALYNNQSAENNYREDLKTLAKELGATLAGEVQNLTVEFDQREVGRMVKKVS